MTGHNRFEDKNLFYRKFRRRSNSTLASKSTETATQADHRNHCLRDSNFPTVKIKVLPAIYVKKAVLHLLY